MAMMFAPGLLLLCMAIGNLSYESCPLHTQCLDCIKRENPDITCHFFVVIGKSRGYFCAGEDFVWTEVEGSMLFSRVMSNETCPVLRAALNIPFQFPSSPVENSTVLLIPTLENPVESFSTESTQNVTDAKNELEPTDTAQKSLHTGIPPLVFFVCVMFLQGISWLLFARAVMRRSLRRFISE